jgi:hypothetical protein
MLSLLQTLRILPAFRSSHLIPTPGTRRFPSSHPVHGEFKITQPPAVRKTPDNVPSILLRTAPARPVDHQELLLHQGALGGNGPRAAGPEEFRDRGQQMYKQRE